MIRRWLVVLTLIGLVLAGVAMTTHTSAVAHPVDAVVASAHSLSEEPLAASSHSHLGDPFAAACPNCTGDLTAGDHAMLMALGCAFVAMMMAALVLFVRSGTSFRMLRPRVSVAHVLSLFVVAPHRPDLLALGISRT